MPATPITRVVILHGYGVTPSQMWFPWIHALIERMGVGVYAPTLPEPFTPDLRAWVRAITPHAKTWGEETLVIGHSAGAVLALRLIEKAVSKKVGPVILVSAPFAAAINVRPYTSFFDRIIDWSAVQKKAASYTIIHAKNDPLVPFDHALRYTESLGAVATILPGGGHLIGKKLPHLATVLKELIRSR